MKACPEINFKSETEWLAALEDKVAILLPIYNGAYSHPDEYLALKKSAANFSGDLFEPTIALDERLNAVIDRAVKRLIHLKATKQMLRLAPADETKGKVVKLPERKRSAG